MWAISASCWLTRHSLEKSGLRISTGPDTYMIRSGRIRQR
jgi:hypothetical protein